jgi:hypothetical protein
MQIVDREVDPNATRLITTVSRSLGLHRLVLVERDSATARGMARELRPHVPPGLSLEVAAPPDPHGALGRAGDAVIVFAPRVWDCLDWVTRSHPRALFLRFRARAKSLEEVGAVHGWQPHPPPKGSS